MSGIARNGAGVLLLSLVIVCLSLLRGFVIPACRGWKNFPAEDQAWREDGEGCVQVGSTDWAAKLLYGIPIDVNLASAGDLTLLDGIGPALSKRIVEHRERRGPFSSIEDLRDVKGIGPKKFEKIREYIAVNK